jgi:hypothetical protein
MMSQTSFIFESLFRANRNSGTTNEFFNTTHRGNKVTQDTLENWLISEDYKRNTAYSYSRAINRLSAHYSQKMGRNVDIYTLRDINIVTEIRNKYRQHGVYSATGNYGNGTNRNAINRYRDYIEHLRNRPQSRSDTAEREAPRSPGDSVAAALAACNKVISELHAELTDLRAKGRRVVGDRNQWEAKAKGYEMEIAALKAGGGDAARFRRAKAAIIKCLHRDAHPNADKAEVVVREKVFKELWPDIEKIEGR